MRIFSRYLWDRKLVGDEEFAIQTAGGLVRSTVLDGGQIGARGDGQGQFLERRNSCDRPAPRSHQRKNCRRRAQVHFLRCDDWQSALRRAAAGNQCRAGKAIRPAARNALELSEPHQRAVPESPRPQEHPDRDLGARRGLHARVGQQQQRGGGGGASARSVRPRDFRPHARRRHRHRNRRRFRDSDDRSGDESLRRNHCRGNVRRPH